MIHTCGQVDVVEHVAFSDDGRRQGARRACRDGAPMLCDSSMVAAGITRTRLPADNDVVCSSADPRVRRAGRPTSTPPGRPPQCELWADQSRRAVLAIGNAPTALFRLLNLIDDGAPTPAAIVGGPVGFVGAAQSERKPSSTGHAGSSYLVVRGRRGGSAITAAAVNAIASEVE